MVEGLLAVSPPLCGTDQAVGHQAKPEIHQQTQVDLEELVAGGLGERGQEDVIRCIPQQHCQERLHVIREH